MKKTMLVFSLTVGAFVCAQSNRETKVISFKNDQEKQEWIRNHPEEYKKMGGTVSSTTPEFKSQAEKDAWVNSRKAVPEFKSQQEKDAWFNIKRVPEFRTSEEKELWLNDQKNIKAKSPKPVFVNTGNPEQDAQNYKAAKESWIKENLEAYKNMNNN